MAGHGSVCRHCGNWIFNGNLGVNFVRPDDGDSYCKNVVWDLEAAKSCQS